MTTIGYVRSSTDEQINSVDAQIQALTVSGVTQVFTDKGVSGKDNILEGAGWLALMATVTAGDRIVVTSQSRLGRRNYEVLYAVGKLIERGASLKVLDEDKVYDNLDNFEQNLNLTFRSINDHTERVEISRRTTQALSYLSSNGVKLGPKPKLTDGDVERIRVLRDGGLGVQAISRTVKKEGKDGRMKPISVNTVKRVLAGGYLTLEDWHAHNDKARASMGRVREAVSRIDSGTPS